jgi:diadenosine tetraphosphate (Ap4A) HIT family hydrolase
MSSDCLFCRIVSGEAPAFRILEDEHTLVPRMRGDSLALHGRVRADESELEALADTLRVGLECQDETSG